MKYLSTLIVSTVIFSILLSCNGSSNGNDSNTLPAANSNINNTIPKSSNPTGAFKWLDGSITQNTTWSGVKYVGYVEVQAGAILTILPGTEIRFRVDRDYKTQNKGGLGTSGGTIKAIGTPNNQIRFTANNDSPINGDWYGISVNNSQLSEFKYIILEYAEIGLEQFDSKVSVTNSIIRWNN